jgi:hypothetical protein
MASPEADRLINPALRARADAEPETVADFWILAILDRGARAAQGIDAPLHGCGRGDAVPS